MSPSWSSWLRLQRDKFACIAQLWFGAFLPRQSAEGGRSLDGKVCIVTGANNGIGFEISLDFARRGGLVYLACRNVDKGGAARDSILEILRRESEDDQIAERDVASRVHVIPLDTSSLESIRSFIPAFRKLARDNGHAETIDILMLNAGIVQPSASQGPLTCEGHGTVYVTNFLGPFVLLHLLEDYLNREARVIFTSSTGQYFGDPAAHLKCPRGLPEGDVPNYPDSKTMQVALSHLLQQRWNSSPNLFRKRLVTHTFVPGFAATGIFQRVAGDSITAMLGTKAFQWLQRMVYSTAISPQQGAVTGIWLATSELEDPRSPEHGGVYWERKMARMTGVDLIDEDKLRLCLEGWCSAAGLDWKLEVE